eukprot:gnl/MRDRNA2_/MRDRNA2_269058_c0_seq1.p1 gnl/MRDRNA2_/MRDRNA2_269058_c0~~gnl/MRDRNA2_/MRDRNA2_269058_c0_seq1.p1  ORF type:complete len:187 (+),score=36.01 gnl/MRDRNA2_/MRDRNA2_269058_c0_seq1:74-562(+)
MDTEAEYDVFERCGSIVFTQNSADLDWISAGLWCTTCPLFVVNPTEVFCLYGQISAMSCILRMAAYAKRQDIDLWMKDEQTNQGCNFVYEGLLHLVTGYSNFLEFIDESGWPWTATSIWRVLAEWKGFEWASDDTIEAAARTELKRQSEFHQELYDQFCKFH